MNRPATKAELLKGIKAERKRLEASFKGLTQAEMSWAQKPGVWSIKDILAHVSAWESFVMGWYETGLKGSKVNKPDFRQPGAIANVNRQIYEANKDCIIEDVLAGFDASYRRILKMIESIPEKDIFTRGRFAWTGTQKLVSYITSNTSSHYPMHVRMIEAVKKKLGKQHLHLTYRQSRNNHI